ncbi:OmpH family outer membrane protein [uncultured Psychrosphaera sp.]|uniref:OmpH family outer membrane protein n=1 Tax=uncultured Psychrosphaera sp. TaxID=1403522 RepID=UPI0026162D43|nr:OmpH family outer membrane protein [uncultured Psychrosphaera sp.]
MTITKTTFLGLIAGILFSASALAENMAVVNMQLVASKIPQTAAMQQALTSEFAGATEEIQKLESDIKFNMEKFQRESMTMSDEQKTTLRTQVEELQKTYQAKAQPLEQQIRRRQTEERNKIFALIQQAISAVAAEEKLDIVLNAQSLAFAKPELDISEKVAAKVSKLN